MNLDMKTVHAGHRPPNAVEPVMTGAHRPIYNESAEALPLAVCHDLVPAQKKGRKKDLEADMIWGLLWGLLWGLNLDLDPGPTLALLLAGGTIP